MQEQEKKKSTFAMGEPHGLKKEPPLKGKLMQAILMYVQGKTKTAISKELDVSLTTIFKWFECPNVQEEISKQQDLLTKEFRD